MSMKNTKQRLFEVMSRVDKTFKPNLSLSEGTIGLPEGMDAKIDELYDIIIKYKDFLYQQSEGRKDNNPYLNSRLIDFFKLVDLNNNPIEVSVGFFNDETKEAEGNMETIEDVLSINMATFIEDRIVFKDLIRHELIHARDPLVRDRERMERYDKKMSGKTDFYHTSQYEYIAFLSPMVKTLKEHNIDPRSVIDLLNRIKAFTGTDEEFLYSTPRELINTFSFGEKKGYGYARFIALYFKPIKAWSKNPILWKDMMKKIYTELSQ